MSTRRHVIGHPEPWDRGGPVYGWDENGWEIPFPRPKRPKRPGGVSHLMKVDTAPMFRPKGNDPAKITLNEVDEIVRYILRLEKAADEHQAYYDQVSVDYVNETKRTLELARELKAAQKTAGDTQTSHAAAEDFWQSERARYQTRIDALSAEVTEALRSRAEEFKHAAALLEEALPLVGIEPDWPLDTERMRERLTVMIAFLRGVRSPLEVPR